MTPIPGGSERLPPPTPRVPPCLLTLTYGSLDAVDGFFLRVDPVSDVSSGSDGSLRRVKTFSRNLASRRWWGRQQRRVTSTRQETVRGKGSFIRFQGQDPFTV